MDADIMDILPGSECGSLFYLYNLSDMIVHNHK